MAELQHVKVGAPVFKRHPNNTSNMAILTANHHQQLTHARTHAHTHTFNGLLSGTTRVSRYQKGKTNLDFTEARDSEWQWHQLGKFVASLLQTNNHASTSPLSFLQAGCPSCCPTSSIKALKAHIINSIKSAEHQTYWRGLKARAEKEEGAEGGSAERGRPHSQQKKIGQ